MGEFQTKGTKESKESEGTNEKEVEKAPSMDNKKEKNIIVDEEDKKEEMNTGHKPVPIKIVNKVMKSICKITIKKKSNDITGTGFFMNVSNSQKYLLTNYHVINPEIINEIIEIEIHNQQKMILNLENRDIKYIKRPKDITAIEIKDSDEIYKYIEFLYYDKNYQDYGYSIYKGVDIFTIEHPYGDDASCASGTIKKLHDYEFYHDISTDSGSSGCPIILNNKKYKFITSYRYT